MSLLTVPIVTNSHIEAGSYFIFLKNVLKQTANSFDKKFGLNQNIGKASKASLSTFLQLNFCNFKLNCAKCLPVTEMFKGIKFERDWGDLETKKRFLR